MTATRTKNLPPVACAYLAPEGFVDDLIGEIGDKNIIDVFDRLVLSDKKNADCVWADNVWLAPQWIEIESIGDASKKLKSIQRNWASYGFDHHRRMKLIEEKLPHVSAKPLKFPTPAPSAPLGSWTMIEPNLILASHACSSLMPNGRYIFDENKTEPPNRAYLKLWEALTRLQKYPTAGETCLDLGASPGGWTWVLQSLGAHVISVDKAPLADHNAQLPGVQHLQESAFGLDPAKLAPGPIDWLFSDIICYPERLYRLVQNWRQSGRIKNMLCTIKFQGPTDMNAVKQFMDIPGSSVYHLYNNKHEVTWVNVQP